MNSRDLERVKVRGRAAGLGWGLSTAVIYPYAEKT